VKLNFFVGLPEFEGSIIALAAAAALVFCNVVFADAPATWNSLRQKAQTAVRQGAYDQAEQLLNSALALTPPQPSLAAVILWNDVGSVRHSKRQLPLAEADFKRALSLNANLTLPDEDQQAVTLNNLGTLASEQRDPLGAERLLREAHALLQSKGKGRSPTAALVLGNIALSLQQQGRFQEASSQYDVAAADVRSFFTEQSLEFARTLTNRALLRILIGRYEDAVADGRRAIQIESALPFVSPFDRALSNNNLGFALSETGRYAEAGLYLREAVRYEEADPKAREQLVASENNLVALEEKQGHLLAAKQHEMRILGLLRQGVQVDDLTRVAVWNNLGRTATAESKFGEARDYLTKALKLSEHAGGRARVRYAATLSNLAALESAQKHYKKAEHLYRRALEIDSSLLGEQHPEVASDTSNLATQLFYQKHYAEALERYASALAIMQRSFGPASPHVARTFRNMAVTHYASRSYERSATAYGQAVEALIRSSAVPDPRLPAWLREYAASLRKVQRYAEAEAAETRALGIEVKAILAQGPSIPASTSVGGAS